MRFINVLKRNKLAEIENPSRIAIGNISINLDTSFKHENKYFIRYTRGKNYPQHDIDEKLFGMFIKKGDVVLDGGANIGITAALALNSGASKIICVEADNKLADRIKKIGDKRIKIYNYALDDHAHTASLILSQTHNQGSTIKLEMKNKFPDLFGSEVQKVMAKTIPQILRWRSATVWKLDIEGAELAALKGGLPILNSKKAPRIIIAELYESFAQSVCDILSFKYSANRVALLKEDYSLELLPFSIGELEEKLYHKTSPTYVFIKSA